MSGQKRKRVVLNIEEKLKICGYIKKGRKFASVAAEFNIGKSTVHDIIKSKAKLQTFMIEIEDGDCIKKRKIVRRADLHELDRAVYLWFIQQRCKGENLCSLASLATAAVIVYFCFRNSNQWSTTDE